jgi:hypothetical protein
VISDSNFKQQMQIRILTARSRLSFAKRSPLEETEGAGKAGCPSAPAASYAKMKSIRASHHRFTGSIRPSLRNGFNDCFVISLVIGFVATIPAQCKSIAAS